MNLAIEKMTMEIKKLKSIVEELRTVSQGIPALDRNLVRISASVRMLEINFIELGSEAPYASDGQRGSRMPTTSG